MSDNFINKIFYGDNLDVMNEKIPDNSVDLIYLDPPFNSNRNYNRIYSQNTGYPVNEEAIAFCDAWELTQEKIDQIRKAGYFKLKYGLDFESEYPRVQILTAEEILNGKTFNLPYSHLLKKS